MKSKKTNRRQFLSDSKKAVTLASYFYGLDQLLSNFLMSNLAQATTEDKYEYRYVNFLLSGGPPRWYFDQVLNPSGKTGDFKAGGFGTELRKSKNSPGWAPVYKAYKMKFGKQTVYMPPVWRLKSAGTGKSFSSLLDNTLMVRGLNMEINSHIVNRQRTVRPVSSSPSITGLVADRSYLPGGGYGFTSATTTSVFSSPKNQSVIRLNKNNPIPTLIAPFQSKLVGGNDFSMQQSLDLISAYAEERGLASAGLENIQESTLEMFTRDLNKFKDRWSGLVSKYEKIVSAELKAKFPNVTSQANQIKPIEHPYFKLDTNKTPAGNMQSAINGCDVNRVAETFAFVEFALTENLSASLSVDLSGSTMLKAAGRTVTNDQHRIGAINSIIFTSLYYRSILGCTIELKDALETAGIFDKTVLHFASEFSRTPKKDGSGSDHGFKGSSTTIISGMIKEPALIGNIRKQSKDGDTVKKYPGTWGEAAPTIKEGSKKRDIVNDDILNTLSEMLQIREVAVKGISLVKNNSGKVILSGKWELKNV